MEKKMTPPDRASRQSKAVPTTALGLEGRRSAPPNGLLCRFSVPLLLRPLNARYDEVLAFDPSTTQRVHSRVSQRPCKVPVS